MNPVTDTLKALNEHGVVFLTGPGGTGKTYTINEIAKQVGMVARTATTGVAATHIKGETIHRFSGIKTYTHPDSLQKITENYFFKDIVNQIYNANLIVIDEVSMLHRKQFDLIYNVFKQAMGNDKPFGGKKVLMSGDFLQLPPVSKNDPSSPWIFHSEAWAEAAPRVIELTKIYRQTDLEFTKTLMNIRKGRCTKEDDTLISSREGHIFTGIQPVRFVATNKEVDFINASALKEIDSEVHEFTCEIDVRKSKSEKHAELIASQLLKDMVAPEVLRIKVGSQVMILKNGDDYHNGSMGTVIHINGEEVTVELTDGRPVTICQAEWEKLDSKDDPVATFTQIPLKLAYALTVHKAQGMTLDRAEIDFKNFFAPGQAYVALSRVRSLEGLRVLNWNRDKVVANFKALDFYDSTTKKVDEREPLLAEYS